jgi:hypothetical protein
LIINKHKSLALGFHHKSNKHTVFPDIMWKGTQISNISELKIFWILARSQFKLELSCEKFNN